LGGSPRSPLPSCSQDQGSVSPSSILILQDSGAEINVAGTHWPSVLSTSAGCLNPVRGVGSIIVKSLALGDLTITFDRAASTPTLLVHRFDGESLSQSTIKDIGTLTEPTYAIATTINDDIAPDSWTIGRHLPLHSAEQPHTRLGMTDPASIRKMHLMAVGVTPITLREGQPFIEPDCTVAAELNQATHVFKEALAFRCISREISFLQKAPPTSV
jgi:hypothetical protein